MFEAFLLNFFKLIAHGSMFEIFFEERLHLAVFGTDDEV
jgi:hypothetical protein